MQPMQRAFWILLFICLFGGDGFAVIFGTMRGIVHDPQHRPILDGAHLLRFFLFATICHAQWMWPSSASSLT